MHEHPLIIRLKALLAQEARLDVAVLETLAKAFELKLWAAMGYASSHEFCVEHLCMSEDSAWRRRKCADLLQRYPALVRPLIVERRVTLTNLAMIHKLVDDDNAERLIREVVGKTKRHVESIVAREAPKPDVSSGIRTVQAPLALTASSLCVADEDSAPVRSEAVVPTSKTRPLEQRSADRHVMRVMLSQATRDKLDQIKQVAPELSLEEIVTRAFDALHVELERTRRAKVARPRRKRELLQRQRDITAVQPERDVEGKRDIAAAPRERDVGSYPETAGPKTHTRYIDAETRRYVLERDNYECQFVGDNGRQCCSTQHIQFHHLTPFALGGPTTADNLKLYCRAHNLYQGELDFGPPAVRRAAA